MSRKENDLYKSEMGDVDELALLLVHPLGADAAFWEPVQQRLCKGFYSIAYDRRGSGRSPIPPRNWTLDDHVRDLSDLCDHLPARRFITVGVAAGAMVAARFAASRPDLAVGAVLCNPMIAMTPEADEFLTMRAVKASVDGMDALAGDVVEAAFAGLEPDEARTVYMDRFRRNHPLGYERTHLGIRGADIRADLARIEVPIAVVTGRHDRMVTVEAARQCASLAANACFTVIESASHFPPIQDPAGFVDAVAPYLERVAAQGRRV